MKKKVLVLGSNGLVGSSVSSYLKDKKFEVIKSTREDTNLFSFQSTKELISNTAPHIIVNAAAKVGGIYANDTHRTEFLLSNLKINMNVLESCIPYKDIKIIN
jgi:GDP-L-fucose synthase